MGLEPDGAASKYERLLSAYNKERGALSRPVAVSKLQALVTYKLALIICQGKYPFSAAEDFMKFARVADPSSQVFSGLDSHRTITRRIEEMGDIFWKLILYHQSRKVPSLV